LAVSVAATAAESGDGPGKTVVKRPPGSIEVPAAEVAALKALKAEAWSVPGVKIKMVRIPAGTFVMGSPKDEAHRFADETQRTVAITKPFYMSAFEVTQKQFYDLMIPDFDFEGWTYFRGPIANGAAYHFRTPARSFGRGLGLLLDNPMECVSWPRALEYCDPINKREQAAGRLPKGLSFPKTPSAFWTKDLPSDTASSRGPVCSGVVRGHNSLVRVRGPGARSCGYGAGRCVVAARRAM